MLVLRKTTLVVCLVALALASAERKVSGCGQESRDLRGTGSLGCDSPNPEASKESGPKTEKEAKADKKLDMTSGTPKNKEMTQVEDAQKKKNKVAKIIYQWPLGWRIALVAGMLAVPLLIVSTLIYCTPNEHLHDSRYIKTALHCSFSFSIGWLNCIMLLRYRVFATMMVGNTILMGVAFVCNGGFGTAKEDDYWWLGKQARVLCPAQFENASHYLIMIVLFMFGAFLQGVLSKKFQWSSRAFAPIIATGIIAVEMIEYFGAVQDSRWDMYLLSPMFGMFVSISAHCGVGSVPWSATGHMTSMAYKLALYVTEWKSPDLHTAVVNLCLWTSFVLGVCAGALFHSNRTVMLNALYLQAVLIMNGIVYDGNGKAEGDSADTARLKGSPSIQSMGDGEKPPNYATCPEAKTESW
jgi:uncharacterized membrane protein YoaK (UPF0700 family)